MASNSKQSRERYRPGLLDFGLNAGTPKGQYQLKVGIDTNKILFESYKGYPVSQSAILNLKGALLYYQHKYQGACKVFKDVLKLDETNLNARQNLWHIYTDLGLWTVAEQYKISKDELDSNLKATYLAEQAFAVMFDCHVSTDESARWERSKNLFIESLKLFKNQNINNVFEWKFWYAELLQRSVKTNANRTEEIFGEAIGLLLEVIEWATDGKCIFKAVAYTCIAQFLYKAKSNNFQIDTIIEKLPSKNFTTESSQESWNENLKKWYYELDELFKMAKAENEDTEVLVRYALYLKGKSRVGTNKSVDIKNKEEAEITKEKEAKKKAVEDIKNAVKLLSNKSIEENWFAINVRSDLYLQLVTLLQKEKEVKQLQNEKEQNKDTQSDMDSESLQTSKPKKVNKPPAKSINSEGNIEETKADDSLTQNHDESNSSCATIEYLNKAIDDGEKAAALNPTCDIFKVLGEAYHMKGRAEEDRTCKDEYYFKALSNFVHAIRHLDGKELPYIHFSHGDCLLNMKQYRPAVESFKRAIECKSRNENVRPKLLRSYIELLKQVGDTEELLGEICHWLHDTQNITLQSLMKENKDSQASCSDSEPQLSCNRIVAVIVKSMLKKFRKPDESVTKAILQPYLSQDYLSKHLDLAIEIRSELVELQTAGMTEEISTILDIIEDSIKENENADSNKKYAETFAKVFVKYRKICCKDKPRYEQVLNVYKGINIKFPNISLEIAEMIAAYEGEACKMFAKVLLHSIANDDSHISCNVDEISDHALHELLHLIKEKQPKDKQLQTCMSKVETYINTMDADIQKYREQLLFPDKDKEPKTRNSNFEYDFYVIYCDTCQDAKDWVLCDLLPTLERRYGFKGCIELRDSRPGSFKLNEVIEHINKSYRILAIVTNAFIKDPMCMYILQHALNHRLEKSANSLIPIIKPDVKHENIPDLLRTTVSVSTVKKSDLDRIVRALDSGV